MTPADVKRLELVIRLGIVSMFIATSIVCSAVGAPWWSAGSIAFAVLHAYWASCEEKRP